MSVCINYKRYIYDETDAFEGIDINKTSASNTCGICHYFYFLDKGINFEPNVRNDCPDVLMISMNLSVIAILKINDCHCIINGISKK